MLLAPEAAAFNSFTAETVVLLAPLDLISAFVTLKPSASIPLAPLAYENFVSR